MDDPAPVEAITPDVWQRAVVGWVAQNEPHAPSPHSEEPLQEPTVMLSSCNVGGWTSNQSHLINAISAHPNICLLHSGDFAE